MRYKRIVCGTDGSEHAQRAVEVAARIARLHLAKLTLVHGSTDDVAGKEVLDRSAGAAGIHGATVSTELRSGGGGDAVCEVADELDADLIVVGSRGLSRARRLVMGSVSYRIAHTAPCDVLVVRRGASRTEGPPYTSVLIGTDGSPTADRCARRGFLVARRLKAGATLVFVGHPQTGHLVLEDTVRGLEQEVAERSKEDGGALGVERLMLEGDPVAGIIEAATKRAHDLVVVGNRGMAGPGRILGSVPAKVIERAPCDVLVLRTAVQMLTELAAGEGGIVKMEGRKVAVYRDGDGVVHALSAKCTHLGCTVGWNPADRTWDCPCHGSRFTTDGEVLNGPASKALPTVSI